MYDEILDQALDELFTPSHPRAFHSAVATAQEFVDAVDAMISRPAAAD